MTLLPETRTFTKALPSSRASDADKTDELIRTRRGGDLRLHDKSPHVAPHLLKEALLFLFSQVRDKKFCRKARNRIRSSFKTVFFPNAIGKIRTNLLGLARHRKADFFQQVFLIRICRNRRAEFRFEPDDIIRNHGRSASERVERPIVDETILTHVIVVVVEKDSA